MGYSLWGHKELDMIERLTHTLMNSSYSVGPSEMVAVQDK